MPLSVATYDYRLPLKKPLLTTTGKIVLRQVTIVELSDGAACGLGEAAPMPVFGGEDPLTCQKALRKALPHVAELAERWIDRDSTTPHLGKMEAILQDAPCARSSIEGALFDWWAQKNNLPLAALYARQGGLAMAESIPVNALLAGKSEDWGSIASQVVAKGWKTIKMKASADLDATVQMVEQVRDWVGSNVHLRLDVNGAWSEEQTHQFLMTAAAVKLEYLEQPLPADQLVASSRLQQKTTIPIALDESVRCAADVANVARYQAGNIVVLKPMVLGGWRETAQATNLARQLHMDVVLSSFIDGAVGRAHATHMAAALGCIDRAQGLATGTLLKNDVATAPFMPKAGEISLLEEPGLGIGQLIKDNAAVG